MKKFKSQNVATVAMQKHCCDRIVLDDGFKYIKIIYIFVNIVV